MGKAIIKGTTQQQKLFAYNFFHNGGNACKAAIDAGYSKKGATQTASRLLTYVNVKEVLDKLNEELRQKAVVSKERVLKELEHVALFDVRQIYDSNNSLKNISDLSDAAAAAITGIEIQEEFSNDPEGNRVHTGNTVKVRLNSKIAAIGTIINTMGWSAPTKIANTDPDGNPVKTVTQVEIVPPNKIDSD